MATVVNLPRDPSLGAAVGRLGGLFIGKSIQDARARERSKEAIEAFEAVMGDEFDPEVEEALVDQRATEEDLAAFMAERRAQAQEERRAAAAPVEQRLREERLEATEQQQGIRERREKREQEAAKRAESQEERARREAERKARQSKDVEVELVNPDTGETLPAFVSRDVVRGEKELPQQFKDRGFQLKQPAEKEGRGAGTQEERDRDIFITVMGGDPDDPKDQDAARRALEARDEGVSIIKDALGIGKDVFDPEGKAKDLFLLATSQIPGIVWTAHQKGKRITATQAANRAVKQAEERLGKIGEDTPTEAREGFIGRVISAREEERKEAEPGFFGGGGPLGFGEEPEPVPPRQERIKRGQEIWDQASETLRATVAEQVGDRDLSGAMETLKGMGMDERTAQEYLLKHMGRGD